MEHLVPAVVAQALRAAGLRPAGPLGVRGRRARWAALDAAGERWAVVEVEPRHAAAARARALTLACVHAPALGAVGPVVETGDGGLLLLGAAPPGTDLATLVAARGRLTDGEVAGLLAPVGEALAALHAAGLAHGGPTDTDVLLTDGGVVLVDAAGLGPDGPGDAARDVAHLARLGLAALGAGLPGPEGLTDAEPADAGPDDAGPADAGPDAAARVGDGSPVAAVCRAPGQDAAAFAAALRAAAVPRDVELPRPEVLAGLALRRLAGDAGRATARDTRRGRHRAKRPLARRVGLAAAVLVGALGVVGAVHGPPGTVRSVAQAGAAAGPGHAVPALTADAPAALDAASAPAVAVPVLWRAAARDAARRLTIERVRAQAAFDAVTLRAVTEPGSPAAELDARVVAAWGEGKRRAWLDGVVVSVGAPRLVGCAPGLVCVPVRCTVRLPGGSEATSSVTLALRPGTWRVVRVAAA